jgi:hypothetical protein
MNVQRWPVRIGLNMHTHYPDGEPGEAAVVGIQIVFRLVEIREYGVVEEETLSDVAGRGHCGPSSLTSLDTSAASPCGCYYKNQVFPRVQNLSPKLSIAEYHP